MMLRTKLCDLLDVEYPIMLAGMGGIANKNLVTAVTNAGGFGTWGSAVDVKDKTPEQLLEDLLEIKRRCCGKPFGVDILVHGAGGGVMKQLIKVFAAGGAKAFISGKGFPKKSIIEVFHTSGILVGSIAGKVSHAVRALEAGVDFVIAQGAEAGGHTGEISLSVLLPQVVDVAKSLKMKRKINSNVCVVAAGGIFDGRGLVSALAMGADGVWVGTRFLLTPEANTHQLYKEKLLKASTDDTTVTRCFTGSSLRVLKSPYVERYSNQEGVAKENSALIAQRSLRNGCWKLHSGTSESEIEYDDSVQAYVCGQNVGAINELIPAATIVQEMMKTARKKITQLGGLLGNVDSKL